MKDPKVSICMPTYNFARYLPDAIESVLMQSYADFEFIIIDNSSTDNSKEIISRYAEVDKRIQFTLNKENIGPVNNLNLCLHKAQGEYIKFVFSDDLLASDKTLTEMLSILEINDDIALVASARYLIDDQSKVLKVLSEYQGKSYVGTHVIVDCLIEQKNRIGEPSAVMFRKKHANRGFDVRYKQATDLEMWFHILEQGDFVYIDEPLCSFREHSEQQTAQNIKSTNLIGESFLLLKDYADKPYVKIPRLKREYMSYVPVYGIWKQYKKKKISRQVMVKKIRIHYSLIKFVVFYPFFKTYRIYYKINQFIK